MNELAFFIAVPLGAAFLIPLLWKLPTWIKDTLAVFVALALAVRALTLLGHEGVFYVGGWDRVKGLGVQMTMDGLSSLFVVVVNVIGFFAALYSVRYMARYTEKAKYWVLFLLMIAGMNGVVLSGDLFNLYVFLEVASIASYALVAFGTGAEQLEASFKYQVMGILGSSLILLGVAILYGLTGTLNLADLGQVLGATAPPRPTILLVEVLFLVGFGLKAAQVPFHAWLPDAHPSAPAPISALLSGVLIKSLGVYALARVFFSVFALSVDIAAVLIALGTISMVVGVLLAIAQNDLKRLLAYSSISQVGYILLGLGVGMHCLAIDPESIPGRLALLAALFHLVNHATFKSLLFLASGSLEYATGTRNLDEMGGLRSAMPVTSGAGIFGSLAIAGVPPFNGFFSKVLLIVACAQAGLWGLSLAAALVAILTLATFLKVQGAAFFGERPAAFADVREAPVSMLVPMLSLAALCLLLSLLLVDPFRSAVLEPAVNALAGGVSGYYELAVGR